MSKFRKGDIVIIRAVIKYDADTNDRLHVAVENDYADFTVKQENVVLARQAIEAGDEVLWEGRSPEDYGIVLAVANGHAWIDLDGGNYCTRMVETVRRREIEAPAND